jgi:ABC-type methionine transport system ATPase subunit
MKDRYHLTFSRERALEPVMCHVAKKFDVTFSIRRASVDPEGGWMDLQLEGAEDEVTRAIAYMVECGVRVDPVEQDIIAG